MINLLFLDIDGVINTPIPQIKGDTITKPTLFNYDGIANRQALLLISYLCAKYNLSIVISSSWRKYVELSSLSKLLYKNGLHVSVPIIGKTPVYDYEKRGVEIREYLLENPKYNEYYIIDDDGDFLDDQKDHLIQTNCYNGFTFSDYMEFENLIKQIRRTKKMENSRSVLTVEGSKTTLEQYIKDKIKILEDFRIPDEDIPMEKFRCCRTFSEVEHIFISTRDQQFSK
ncbi:MAG: HAD domain-containing protein [Herbinix sp.]|nr:HAD domain-containing protein [Herbinix sp.]